jgi:hypothetical protein
VQAEEWGEDRPRRLDEPLRRLHHLKDGEWPFFAVFQKALFRATKIAFQHYEVLPYREDVSFREAWIGFLNAMAEKGVFKVRHQVGASLLWAGIGLNPVNPTVNWSEASAQRITALIAVWWYFYSYKLKNARQFLNKLDTTQAAPKFPQGKELAVGLRRGLQPLVKSRDEELDPQEIKARVERRLRELVLLARHTGATDEADNAIAAVPAADGEPADLPPSDDGQLQAVDEAPEG